MAIIRCTLVTADKDRRGPHAHRLVRRVGNSDEDDPHEIKVSPEIGFQASYADIEYFNENNYLLELYLFIVCVFLW